ncbi:MULTISPECIES: PrsW family glutamic-type intramembrane protease [unclassified Streptomyces]|uniref:PrsW family glutamic-type intramembrane protease n=1 Tax=unclassified Streptomyces TaxID=2593676 RepID=UPI00131A0C18|nr:MULTISPECIES: PrsW family glutamic-type intramembrane protease [unclassified Streptomyces]MYT32906.1 PrsW family intramembrane metalloprotease [Streptomyces sp. SID8354]
MPIRNDQLAHTRALLIARIALVLYLVELLLNLTRPRVMPGEPSLSIFYKAPSGLDKMPGFADSLDRLLSMPRAVFWCLLAGIAAGVVLQIVAAVTTRRSDRRPVVLTWLTLGCLLLPFGLLSLVVVIEYVPVTLACVPSTVCVLLLLRGGVRFARVPLAALLAAFGWGALIVFGLGRAYSGLAFGTIFGYLGQSSLTDISRFAHNQFRSIDLLLAHLSVVDALAIAGGVVLLFLLFRHRVTDAVSGLILGAAVGLGFNFVESILYIKIYGSLGDMLGSSGGFAYWIRQSVGLLGGQVACGALLGAGLGVAARARQRGLVAAAAVVAAIGATTGADILSGWLSGQLRDQVDVGSTLDVLVVSPALWLLPQLPFIALAVVLLARGLRARAPALKAAVAKEVAAGSAITQAEVPVLVSPVLRLWAVAGTWRWHGRRAALALHRLHSVQLDLASQHVRTAPASGSQAEGQASGQAGEHAGERADLQTAVQQMDELRARIARLKGGQQPEVTP